MPPSLREWLPVDHLAWFILAAVEDSISGPSTPAAAQTATATQHTTRR
jgi:hypothetical protein